MSKGGTCCFADKNALRGNLLENMKHFRPSRFVGVPRVFEKIEEGMKAAGAKSGLKKKLADWAKSEALAHHAAEEGGKAHTSLGYRLAHKLILSKVFFSQCSMLVMLSQLYQRCMMPWAWTRGKRMAMQ